MNISILSPAFPLRGGIANFTNLLASELTKDNNVEIITFKRQYPSLLFPGKTQLEESNKKPEVKTKIILDSINPFNWISIGKEIRKSKPDYLIISYWMPFFAPCFGVISRIVKKNNFTKIICICHNILPHEKKPGDKVLTKWFLKKVDKHILLSEQVKNDLLSVKADAKFKILFHPIYSNFGKILSKNEAREYLKIKKDKVILFFGFIREYKGLDTLLEAVSILKNKMDLTTIIAGEFYSNEDKYKKLIKEFGIEDSLKLYNEFIPAEDVKYFFSAADLVVLPYKDATQSGIIQIAKHFNKPIISTKVGGLAEVVEHGKTGYLVEKENPNALADAVYKFYEENKEKEFSENIEQELEKYSWVKFAEGIFEE